MDLAQLRKDYALTSLDIGDVAVDPVVQFERWMRAAIDAKCPEPTAMSLATVGADGRPSSRIVLLKGCDQRGFVFYTNYLSRKGKDLAHCPHAALLFHWVELEREVRIEGRVEKTSDAESDAYFNSRPIGSRISAAISPQSDVVANRAALETLFSDAEARLAGDVQRPAHWGGYRIVPTALEFWQGRRSRLHDRLTYIRSGTDSNVSVGWSRARLAP